MVWPDAESQLKRVWCQVGLRLHIF